MSTEERLERLERQNRWMRRLGAVGVARVFSVGTWDKDLESE